MSGYPVQRTWVTGEIVTAAMLNANVRDAVNFFTNPPLAVLKQTSPQTIPTGVFTDILMDSEELDQDPNGPGGHSTSSSTQLWTAHVGGWYAVAGTVGFAFNATGWRGARLKLVSGGSTTSYRLGDNDAIQTTGIGTTVGGVTVVPMGFGDTIALQGRQDSGGNLNTVIVENTPRLAIWALSST